MLSWLLRRRMAGIETSGIPSDGDTVRKRETLKMDGRSRQTILLLRLFPLSYVLFDDNGKYRRCDGYLNKESSKFKFSSNEVRLGLRCVTR